MIDYVKTVNLLGKIHRKVSSDFSDFLKSKEIEQINSQELLILVEINNYFNHEDNEEKKSIFINEIADRGMYLVQHLLFHLNRLEKKNFIVLIAEKNQKFLSVKLTDYGNDFLAQLSTISFPRKKDIKNIQQTIETAKII